MDSMYYIGLDIHKKTISYCVKDQSGRVCDEGTIPATRMALDRWMDTLAQPWTAAMEATMFTAWTLPRGYSSERRNCFTSIPSCVHFL
jgi:transposase